MARRRGRSRGRRGRSRKLPIISLGILAGQGVAAWQMSGGNWLGAVGDFVSFYTGYIPHVQRFEASRLLVGYAPWIAKRFLLPIARPRVSGLPISIS